MIRCPKCLRPYQTLLGAKAHIAKCGKDNHREHVTDGGICWCADCRICTTIAPDGDVNK